MDKDAFLQSALPSMQLEKLVVEPLEAVIHDQGFPPCIIVIDALDECKEENTNVHDPICSVHVCWPLFSYKFFITSRPVTNVVGRLSRDRADAVYKRAGFAALTRRSTAKTSI